MTEREQWRFQWPDGTWIQWNPETEQWEKESGSPVEPPETEAASSTSLPSRIEWPSAPAPATDEPGDDSEDDEELYDFEEPEEDDDTFDEDDDDEGSRTRARPAEPVFAGRQLDERPGRSLMPTILGGAAIGLVVGIIVTILIR